MTGTTGPDDLTGLFEFFSQCPVGLVETDGHGSIRRINPAATRMLVPALDDDEDLQELRPLLRRLAPRLLEQIDGGASRLGPIGSDVHISIPGRRGEEHWIEVMMTRVDEDTLSMALVDVTAERHLARRGHEIAIELQKSMLGRIDPIHNLPFSVTYRAADAELQVGGDWYDVIDLGEGSIGLVVGDVVGHSLEAMVAMGELRAAIRTMAPWCANPAELLDRADALAEQIDNAECSTMAYAVLDRRGGRLSYASAGHPPILVVRQNTAKYLAGGIGPPLTCAGTSVRQTAQERLAIGDVVVLYTDGLVERRDQSLEMGLFDLRSAVRTLDHFPASDYSDRLAATMLADQPLHDDLCILAIRYLGPDRPFNTADRGITALAGKL